MDNFPTFAEFYEACHSQPPLPWQNRLANLVAESGWPSEIGVPTGLGKTTCLDIAIWSLAIQGKLLPEERTVPTRIWYVVNRRLLVDDTYQKIEELQDRLEASIEDHHPHISPIAEALRDMGAMGTERFGPLHLTLLRGGADKKSTTPDPSQPTVIMATVPMFASRWLFRGYGETKNRRPIDAALAGIDSLVLLDEAHLSGPLQKLVQPLRQCDPGVASHVIPEARSAVQFVSLTATGASDNNDRFDLDDEDREHPIVRQRIHANKTVTLAEQVKSNKLSNALADEVRGIIKKNDSGNAGVVFVNGPRMARDVAAKLNDGTVDVYVLTGRMREREASSVRLYLLKNETGIRSAASRVKRDRPLVVVATQTLEVGADLDFDFLVTESASVRALTQRFGRLNRLGNQKLARGVICHASDYKSESSIYGDASQKVWERLKSVDQSEFSLSPNVIADVLGPPEDDSIDVPELLPVHVWEWVKTSCPPVGEAPPSLFFEGFSDDRKMVSVLWRAVVPESGKPFPSVAAEEIIEVSIKDLRQLLADDGECARITSDGTLEKLPVQKVRPGDVLMLNSHQGGYGSYWDVDSKDYVFDVSPLVSGELILDEDAHSLRNLVPNPSDELRSAWNAAVNTTEDFTSVAKSLIDELRNAQPRDGITSDEWQTFLDELKPSVKRPVDEHRRILHKAGFSHVERPLVALDAFDELSFSASSIELHQHMGAVGELAEKTAQALGCDNRIVATCKLAGEWHDIGKADPRFQRWLSPGSEPENLLAKSDYPKSEITAMRIKAGWPKGGRHELLSGQLLNAALEAGWKPSEEVDIELFIHLVQSHHGGARPLLNIAEDPWPVTFSVSIDGVDVKLTADLSQQDWNQPARFRSLCEKYGYWGLALLESIVRLADHAASSQSPDGKVEVL